jgi:hypothetical protein
MMKEITQIWWFNLPLNKPIVFFSLTDTFSGVQPATKDA